MSERVIFLAFMFNILAWAFILPNLRQIFLKVQRLYLWLSLQRLKYIRYCYQTLKYKNNDFQRLHREIKNIQISLTQVITSVRKLLTNGPLFNDKVRHKSSVAQLERNLAQFERVLNLITQYEEFILEREFNNEFDV